MEKIGNKVSYIRKPIAQYSYVSAGLSAAAVLFGAVSVYLSYACQGNPPLVAGALALCSIVTTISAAVYGVFSFFEKDKNYILAKICLVLAGVLICFWLVVLAAARIFSQG